MIFVRRNGVGGEEIVTCAAPRDTVVDDTFRVCEINNVFYHARRVGFERLATKDVTHSQQHYCCGLKISRPWKYFTHPYVHFLV